MLTEGQMLPSSSSDLDFYIDEIVKDIHHPKGWDIVDEASSTIVGTDEASLGLFKKFVNDNIEEASRKTEMYIYEVKQNFGIIIEKTYIGVDVDYCFHELFLVNQDDFLSPKLIAAKLLADRYFASTEKVGYRYSFSITEQFNKLAVFTKIHRIKYIRR